MFHNIKREDRQLSTCRCRDGIVAHRKHFLFREPLMVILNIFSMCYLNGRVASAPHDPTTIFDSGTAPGALYDPGKPLVHKDDDGNVYFDVYAIKGDDYRIMSAKDGVLLVSIGPPVDLQSTSEYHLWEFIGLILQLENVSDMEILLFPGEAVRRVLLRNIRMTAEECQAKINEYLQPYIPRPGPRRGQTESPLLLNPYNPLVTYAENDTQGENEGPLKYYEVDVAELSAKEDRIRISENLPENKLLEMKPFYEKNPSFMAKLLRDLNVNKEVVFRGRLRPGSPVRPVLDDYRGHGKIKMVRRILEAVTDGSGVSKPKTKTRFETTLPLPGAIMLDYLSADKQHVVSRRVVNPLFRNETLELVEELEYTEVV